MLAWWRVFSLWLVPWAVANAAVPRLVTTPFPAALASTVFNVGYIPAIGGTLGLWAFTVAWHGAVAALSFRGAPSLSWTALLSNLAIFLAYSAMLRYHAGTSFAAVYGRDVPKRIAGKPVREILENRIFGR
nr:hypothetical protein TetV2_00335 [Oceanusvirus sp.]